MYFIPLTLLTQNLVSKKPLDCLLGPVLHLEGPKVHFASPCNILTHFSLGWMEYA